VHHHQLAKPIGECMRPALLLQTYHMPNILDEVLINNEALKLRLHHCNEIYVKYV
jgi:hypothetical protein